MIITSMVICVGILTFYTPYPRNHGGRTSSLCLEYRQDNCLRTVHSLPWNYRHHMILDRRGRWDNRRWKYMTRRKIPGLHSSLGLRLFCSRGRRFLSCRRSQLSHRRLWVVCMRLVVRSRLRYMRSRLHRHCRSCRSCCGLRMCRCKCRCRVGLVLRMSLLLW